MSRWGRSNGRYALEEHRAEALQRARVADAAWAARQAVRVAEEAAKLDVFGFGVTR